MDAPTSPCCVTCAAPLSEGETALKYTACLCCRVLARFHTKPPGRGDITPTLFGRRERVTRTPPLPLAQREGVRWSVKVAEQAIAAWSLSRGHFPTTTDLQEDGGLPSPPTVRRLFGSYHALRVRLEHACPTIDPALHRAPWGWSVVRICAAVDAWIAAHGRIPLVADFKCDRSLPAVSGVYVYFGGGLQAFYAAYCQGQYADTYAAHVRDRCVRGGRASAAKRYHKDSGA